MLWISFLILSIWASASQACPKKCFCNAYSKIVYCSRRGLKTIPSGIPEDSLQINFNGNVFENGAIQRANFSKFTALEHLYMSECGIERIEEDTFIDLVNLKWLDLSNNQIRILQDYSFRGLDLMHLFLNGNRNVQLNPKAFEGLVTTGLYLHECALSDLKIEVLLPLNSTLRYLWLNGNELEKVDKNLLPLFTSLSHLRMGSNPLHCNCEVLWLKEFYDTHAAIFEGASAPTCLTPQKLKSKQFNQLTLFEFRCQSPVFNNIDAVFNNLQGKLRCTATGDPAPTIYWIQPSGHSFRYNPPADENVRKNEGMLVLNAEDVPRQDLTGQYFCVAINEAGNVTLTLNASWPHQKPEKEIIYRTITHPPPPEPGSGTVRISTTTTPETVGYQNDANKPTHIPVFNIGGREGGENERHNLNIRPVDTIPGIPRNDPEVITSPPSKGTPDNSNKLDQSVYNLTALNMLDLQRRNSGTYFNITEMIGAVIGTFVCTLLLCLIFMPLYYKRKWRQERDRHRAMEKPPNETLYLNGLGHHQTYRDYLDTPTSNKR